MLRKWIHNVCVRLDIAALYNTAAGIKCVNRPLFYERLERLTGSEVILLDADELRLGFDGLRDGFTLLDTLLPASPHFDLTQRLEAGSDWSDSDYVSRLRSGALDFRPGRRTRERQFAARREKFLRSRAVIAAGGCEPVKVFRVGGRPYVADGKHRAAVCALLGRRVPCRDATPGLHDSFYWWVWRKMEKTPAQFQKHIRWFEAANAGRKPA